MLSLIGVVLVVLLVIFYIKKQSQENMENNLEIDELDENIMSDQELDMIEQSEMSEEDITNAKIEQKFKHRNQSADGKKVISYKNGDRGFTSVGNWQKHFDNNNKIIGVKSKDNKIPNGSDIGSDYASFKSKKDGKCGVGQDCSPDELFDIDKYLPQEMNDDWFENVPEPISVKNRHLINTTRSVGINTIGSSNRNASHDIRGVPTNPKFVISPFLNSSIEPSIQYRPLS